LYEYFDISEVNFSDEAGGMVEATSATRSNFRFGMVDEHGLTDRHSREGTTEILNMFKKDRFNKPGK